MSAVPFSRPLRVSFLKILEALECIAEDQSQKGDTRREGNNIANKMQELEFVFMLNFWDEILQNVLQNEDVNLKHVHICMDH